MLENVAKTNQNICHEMIYFAIISFKPNLSVPKATFLVPDFSRAAVGLPR
jgi:hypothetical protein